MAERIPSTLTEIETQWSLDDLADAHDIVDAYEIAERKQAAEHQRKLRSRSKGRR